jgi:formiminotetrahydrofolate cyclodeaminase
MSTSRDDFAAQLAAATPTPGGGAAAARTGRHACALIRMVAGITSRAPDGSPGAPGRKEVQDAGLQAGRLQEDFEAIEAEDIAAFEAYLAALRLPRSTPAERAARQAARGAAAARATEAPLRTLRAALEAIRLAAALLDLSRTCPLKAESDLGVSIELAAGAFRAAEMNIRVNLPGVPPERRAAIEGEWTEARAALEALYPPSRQAAIERLGGR